MFLPNTTSSESLKGRGIQRRAGSPVFAAEHRRRQHPNPGWTRRAAVEPLEQRRLLALVTVGNDTDVVNGDVASVAALLSDNGGDGISLREAIEATNATAGTDEIEFDPALAGGVIILDGSELRITDDLTVTGLGPHQLAVDANGGQHRVMLVDDGTTEMISVGITGLTLSGSGSESEAPQVGGGGLSNNESLTLEDCIISENYVWYGGGLRNSGNLVLKNSKVSRNWSRIDYGSGGIQNFGQLTIVGSTITENQGGVQGGGIANSGVASIQASTISGNSNGYKGGGIWNIGELRVTDSTISGNQSGVGGGVINYGALFLTNSTISGNTATSGGGIYSGQCNGYWFNPNIKNVTTVLQSTISGNRATDNGGGWKHCGVGQVSITNSIIANSVSGGDFAVEAGSYDDILFQGVNIVADGSVTTEPNIIAADPLLGPLADNGGPTLTHALLSGSPAIGSGVNEWAVDPNGDPLMYDQRGASYERIIAGVVDLGALESSDTTTPRPVATADAVVTDEDVPLAAIDVLANDSDPDGGSLSLVFITQPSHGTASINADDTVAYTPDPDYHGPDSFSYQATNGVLDTNIAIVSIEVESVNDAPTARNDVSAIPKSGPATAIDVLANDSDLEDDPLRIVSVDVSGTLGVVTIAADGLSLTYDPNSQFDDLEIGETATDVFRYTIEDGPGDTSTAEVVVTILGHSQTSDALIVDTLIDESDGDFSAGDFSLREAIEVANLTPGFNEIAFSDALAGGVILLGGSELRVTDDLTITGLGADLLAVDGNGGEYSVFVIDDGTSAKIDVEIEGLTIRGSQGDGVFNIEGGGLHNKESLVLDGCEITQNFAWYGGGIWNASGANLVLKDSNVSENTATIDYASGGIINYGDLLVVGSTISGNRGGIWGGGIGNWGTASLVNSTVVGNSAEYGGGLWNAGESVLTNSIVANNGRDVEGNGAVTTSGVNLVRDGSLSGPNVLNVDPLLGPLADNGGPTRTHALLPGSPAIDAGVNALAVDPDGNPLAFDQRGVGFPRLVYSFVDLGAFEVQEGTSAPPTANPDAATMLEDAAATTIDVLANDVDPGGALLSIVYVTDPPHGKATVNPDETVSYQPDPNFFGTDSFSYKASNGVLGSNVAVVTVTVQPVNDPPQARNDAATVSEDGPAKTIYVLANDSDPDGDALTITGASGATGLVTIAPDGKSLTYNPNGQFDALLLGESATDLFSYTIGDGHGGAATAQVTVTVQGASDGPIDPADYYYFGDVNDDGVTDLFDFVILKANFGSFYASRAEGDLTGDGIAGLDDFAVLKQWFGWQAPVADQPPTVDIVDVTPDPRINAPVAAIDIVFSEPVTGFDLSDLVLDRALDGLSNLLTGAETLTTADGQTYTLGGLARLTGRIGDYTLKLKAEESGIADFAGNPLETGAIETWRNNIQLLFQTLDDPLAG